MAAAPPPLAERLRALIAAEGPITVERWMGLCNAHYYATRDPFGPAGDFVTAPEVSQMFGELLGIALADLWDRAGRPADAVYVELGPGRGTLARDALRAMAGAGLQPAVHLVETSPLLRDAQAKLFPDAVWHDGLSTLPHAPSLMVANEFFDALPVRQMRQIEGEWRERRVTWEAGRFTPSSAPAQGDGYVQEANPSALAIVAKLARHFATHGGALLAIDYGHTRTAPGDTLQAVSRHAYASPWDAPGTRDLTAHVDFAALAAAAETAGGRTHGPVEQGAFLTALGLAQRAAALARAHPERQDEIATAYRRLADPAEMGRLFKVVAVVAPDWPGPAGM